MSDEHVEIHEELRLENVTHLFYDVGGTGEARRSAIEPFKKKFGAKLEEPPRYRILQFATPRSLPKQLTKLAEQHTNSPVVVHVPEEKFPAFFASLRFVDKRHWPRAIVLPKDEPADEQELLELIKKGTRISTGPVRKEPASPRRWESATIVVGDPSAADHVYVNTDTVEVFEEFFTDRVRGWFARQDKTALVRCDPSELSKIFRAARRPDLSVIVTAFSGANASKTLEYVKKDNSAGNRKVLLLGPGPFKEAFGSGYVPAVLMNDHLVLRYLPGTTSLDVAFDAINRQRASYVEQREKTRQAQANLAQLGGHSNPALVDLTASALRKLGDGKRRTIAGLEVGPHHVSYISGVLSSARDKKIVVASPTAETESVNGRGQAYEALSEIANTPHGYGQVRIAYLATTVEVAQLNRFALAGDGFCRRLIFDVRNLDAIGAVVESVRQSSALLARSHRMTDPATDRIVIEVPDQNTAREVKALWGATAFTGVATFVRNRETGVEEHLNHPDVEFVAGPATAVANRLLLIVESDEERKNIVHLRQQVGEIADGKTSVLRARAESLPQVLSSIRKRFGAKKNLRIEIAIPPDFRYTSKLQQALAAANAHVTPFRAKTESSELGVQVPPFAGTVVFGNPSTAQDLVISTDPDGVFARHYDRKVRTALSSRSSATALIRCEPEDIAAALATAPLANNRLITAFSYSAANRVAEELKKPAVMQGPTVSLINSSSYEQKFDPNDSEAIVSPGQGIVVPLNKSDNQSFDAVIMDAIRKGAGAEARMRRVKSARAKPLRGGAAPMKATGSRGTVLIGEKPIVGPPLEDADKVVLVLEHENLQLYPRQLRKQVSDLASVSVFHAHTGNIAPTLKNVRERAGKEKPINIVAMPFAEPTEAMAEAIRAAEVQTIWVTDETSCETWDAFAVGAAINAFAFSRKQPLPIYLADDSAPADALIEENAPTSEDQLVLNRQNAGNSSLERLHPNGPSLEQASGIVVVLGGESPSVELEQMASANRRDDSDVLLVRATSDNPNDALSEALALKREGAEVSILVLPDAVGRLSEVASNGVGRVWVPRTSLGDSTRFVTNSRFPENVVQQYVWNDAAFPIDVVNSWWVLQGSESESPKTLVLCADWNAQRLAPTDVYDEPHAGVAHALEPLPAVLACRPTHLREVLRRLHRDKPDSQVYVVGDSETHAVIAALSQDEFPIAPSMFFLEHDEDGELGAHGLPPGTVLAPLPEREDDRIDTIEWYGAQQPAIDGFAQQFVADTRISPALTGALSELVPEDELLRGALVAGGRAVAYLPTAAGFLLAPQRRIVLGSVDVNQTRPISPWEGVATIVYEPGPLGLADAQALASHLAQVGHRPEQFIVETTDPELAQTVAALEVRFVEQVEAEQSDAPVADAPATLEELKRTLRASSARERGLRGPQWVEWPADNAELEPGTRVLIACTPSEDQAGLLTRTVLNAPTAFGEFDEVVDGLLLAREVGPRSRVTLVVWPGQLQSVLDQIAEAGERCVLPDALLASEQDVDAVWSGVTPSELFGHPVAIFSDGLATGAFGKKSVNNTFGLLTPLAAVQESLNAQPQEPSTVIEPRTHVDAVPVVLEAAPPVDQPRETGTSVLSTIPKPAPPTLPLKAVQAAIPDQALTGETMSLARAIDQITPQTDVTKLGAVIFARIPPELRGTFAETIRERFPESVATDVHYFEPQDLIDWEPALLMARANHPGLPLVICLHSSVTALVGGRWARVPVEALPDVVMVREGKISDEFYRRLPNFVLPISHSDPLPSKLTVEDAIISAPRHVELFKDMRAAARTANSKRTFWPGMEIVDGGEAEPGLLIYPLVKVGASERTLLLSSPHMLEERAGEGLTADVLGKVSESVLYDFMREGDPRRLTVRLSDHPSLGAVLSALDHFVSEKGDQANVHVEVQGRVGREAAARVQSLVQRNVTTWPSSDRVRISEPAPTLTLDVSNNPREMGMFDTARKTQAEHRLVIPPDEDGRARYRERVRQLGDSTRVLARCLPGQELAFSDFLGTLSADELPAAVFVDEAGLRPFADADVPDWLPIIATNIRDGLPEVGANDIHTAIRDRQKSRAAHRLLSAEAERNPTLYEAVRQAGQMTFVPRGHARYGRDADSQLFSPALCITLDDNATPRGAIFSGGSPAFATEAHIFLSQVMPIGFKGRHQRVRRSDVLGDVQPETLLEMVGEQGATTFRLAPHPALASAVEAIEALLSRERPVQLELREAKRSAELREAVQSLNQHPNSRWLSRYDPMSPRGQSL